MRRRLFSCVSAILLIFNVLAINISAADSTADFEKIFDTAFKRYTMFYNADFSSWYDDSPKMNRFFEYIVERKENGSYVTVTKPNPLTGMNTEYSYCEFYFRNFSNNTSQPIVTLNTLDDATTYISECCTKELTKRFMCVKDLGAEVNLFEISETGALTVLFAPRYFQVNYVYDSFKNLKVNGNNASAQITLWYFSVSGESGKDIFGEYEEGEPCYFPMTATVEFTKTADGWRVSGGTAFEVMLGDREPNPTTGDPSAIAIPALTAAAVISLALPVGIMRRRRRYA